MSIVKWFIEKVQKLVQSHRNRKWNKRVEKEYTNLLNDPNLTEEQYRQWCVGSADDEIRQEAEAHEREYLEQCHKEDEREAKQAEEILHVERLVKLAEQQHPLCPGCHKVWCECIIAHDESKLE